MPEMDQYIHKLMVTNPLMEPVYREAIRNLRLPKGSHGLDVGCGIGLQAILLAEEIGAEGEVVGLDISPELLARAGKNVAEAGLSGRISFEAGDMNKIPFDDNTFDWLWSANCAGYPARKPLPFLKELSRVVKPGGRIALLIYASQLLLGGYPVLEAKLNATSAGIAPFTPDMKPETHHLRVLGWFQEAGFDQCAVQTMTADFHAPLGGEIKEALAALIEMRWGGAEPELLTEDRDLFQRLTRPGSPDYIINILDYYAFIAFSLFQARVPR